MTVQKTRFFNGTLQDKGLKEGDAVKATIRRGHLSIRKSIVRDQYPCILKLPPYFGDVWKCQLHQGDPEINTSRQDKREMDGASIVTKPGNV